MGAAARTAFWLILASVCGFVASAFFAFPIALPATLALATLAVLAAFRTQDALLVFAGLAPIAGGIHALSGLYYDPAALLEVAALSLLGGAAMRAAFRHSVVIATRFDAAICVFAMLAAASCLVQMPVIFAPALDPVEAAWRLFRREYFLHEAGYVAVERSALLIEGAALAALVARTCRQRATALRFSAMLLLGGTAAAALNLHRLFEVSLRNPPFLESLWQVLLSIRFNTQFADLNAAGSLFAAFGVLAVSRVGWGSRSGWLHAAAVPMLLCALWISGSRVALAATLLCVLLVWLIRRYDPALFQVKLRIVLPAAVGVLSLALLLVFLLPATRHGNFGFSVNTRIELFKVGVRMMQDRPLFGVGTSRFYTLFPRYTSNELQRAFEDENGRPIPRENAHNQFVQFGAELGLTGVVAFALVLLAAFSAAVRQPERLPEAAALAAFLITALAGHPLLTPLVAWPFWILTGVVAAGAEPLPQGVGRRLTTAVVTGAIVLSAGIPSRWRLERHEADFAGVRVGFSSWERDESGMRFQVAGRRSAVFVPQGAVVRIPLRSADTREHRVYVMLDGNPASAVSVRPETWLDLVLPLRDAHELPAYRRVDLIVADAVDKEEQVLLVGRIAAAKERVSPVRP